MPDCKPPSEIDPKGASGVGDIIEGVIRADYCTTKGGCQIFPAGAQDFADMRVFGTQTQFIAFLKLNNPGVNEVALALQAGEGGLLRVPDLLTHQPPRFEYYEVKPNSSSGLREGRKKITQLVALFGTHRLPYTPGVIYTPNRRIPILVESTGLYEVEVSVRFFRLEPALVVYEICTETRLRVRVPDKVKDALLRALLIAALAAILIMFGPKLVPA